MSSSIDINWTNRSASVQPPPDKNIVERVEQSRFDDLSAAADTQVLAEGAGGALSPTAATGTYTDDTLEVGRNYSYRVVAERGSQKKASIPTDYIHTYDPAVELGYPGGTPEVANYTCSVAPHSHIDMQYTSAVSTAYDDPIITMEPAIRTGDITLRRDANSTSEENVFLDEQTLSNGRKIRTPRLQQYGTTSGPEHNITYLTTTKPNIFSRDEMTMFAVLHDPLNKGYSFQNPTSYTSSSTLSRTYEPPHDIGPYTSDASLPGAWGGIPITEVRSTKSSSGAVDHLLKFSVNNISYSATMPNPTFSIICIRLKMSEALALANNIKMQMWQNGALVGNSADLTDITIHGRITGKHSKIAWNKNFGAYNFTPNMLPGGSYYSSRYYEWAMVTKTEFLLFPHALEAEDINNVYGYLCNKYDVGQTIIQSSQLIG